MLKPIELTEPVIPEEAFEEEAAPCESEESCELKAIEPTNPEVWEEPE